MAVTVTSHGKRSPYAVFNKLSESTSAIEKLVTQNLGPNYTLGGVTDLDQLGMKEWPRNIAGKISIKDVEHAVANREHA